MKNDDEKMYTHDQLRIALLEQSNTGILETLKRFETKLEKLDSKIDSHFHWTIGSISVLYISLIGTLVTALAKSLGWF
jgi:hypothetical protein